MIVPMKKVFLVVLDSEKKEALKKLRKAGLVHLSDVEGKGEVLARNKSEFNTLESAYMQLSEVKLTKAESKALVPVDAKGTTVEDALAFAKDVLGCFETKKAAENLIIQNSVELERFAKWGKVSPEDLTYLQGKGVSLALYEIPANKYNSIGKDVETVYVNSDKGTTRFLLLNAPEGRPEGLPPEAFAITLPVKSSETMLDEITAARKTIADVDAKLHAAVAKLPVLKTGMGISGKEIEFENVFSGMEHEENSAHALAWITGFVPAEDETAVKTLAKEENWGYASCDPSDEDAVPTKLKNNKFVSLIYPVSDFLGTVPGYTEYDISGWFLLFFCIFFGMIFGDGGYGLLMVVAALFAMLKSKGKPAPAICLLMLLGATTMLWGMVTCNWFGIPVDTLPAWLKNLSLTGGPLPLSNVKAAESAAAKDLVSQNLQVFCFILALIQLSVAHLKGIVRNIKSLKAFGELGSLGMVFGLFFLVLNMVVDANRFPLPSWAIPVIGGGFALSFIFANYEGSVVKSILESLKNIVSVLLGVVNNFSDIVSYIRLWAVGLAGSAISETVNNMAGPMLGGFIIFAGVLLLCFGHGLNMVLNLLSVIVHGVRLNTLEFSSHLGMSWSGFSYEPFSETVEK